MEDAMLMTSGAAHAVIPNILGGRLRVVLEDWRDNWWTAKGGRDTLNLIPDGSSDKDIVVFEVWGAGNAFEQKDRSGYIGIRPVQAYIAAGNDPWE